MSKVQSWWIYQGRRVTEPWTIHVFCTKEGRKIRCDFDLFAEWIPNKSRRLTARDIPTSERFIQQVQDICVSLGVEFTESDAQTIREELTEMLKQFK